MVKYTVDDLKEIASHFNITGLSKLRKNDIIAKLEKSGAYQPPENLMSGSEIVKFKLVHKFIIGVFGSGTRVRYKYGVKFIGKNRKQRGILYGKNNMFRIVWKEKDENVIRSIPTRKGSFTRALSLITAIETAWDIEIMEKIMERW
jgi:hypothetical protein